MLRVANVYQNYFSLSEIHTIGLEQSEIERVLLQKEDLLIVEGNGSRDQIGRMAVWMGQIPKAIHQNHLIKARFVDTRLVRYVLLWFMSSAGRAFIEKVASSTTGLHTLSLSKVNELVVPLPSIDEAEEIIDKVNDIFSQIDALENWCATELTRSATLRQSILKSAFSGILVPQDSADEPASELLARIQSARAAPKPASQKATAPMRRGRRKKSDTSEAA